MPAPGKRVLAGTLESSGSSALLIPNLPVTLSFVLRSLPPIGPLFPRLREVQSKDRANEFRQRCLGLGIKGISLHSYRYAWAERIRKAGYPERFAQEALGHNSKAVHRAYAKRAEVRIDSLEQWEKKMQDKVVEVRFGQPSPEKSDGPAGHAVASSS